jgi:hypothetical protein
VAVQVSEIHPKVLAQAMKELKQLEGQGLQIGFTHGVGLAVLSAIQSAARDPSFTGAQRDFAIEFANKISEYLGGPERPAVDEVIRHGWLGDEKEDRRN